MSSNMFVGDYKEAKKARSWLIELLQQFPVEVIFIKKDGTERVMLCTLSEDYLPESYEGSGGRKKSEETLAVFDIEEDDWRSFRWDSIKEIKFKLEANYA